MVFALVYNLVRAAMASAAARQGIADANRMSFIDALRSSRATAVTAANAAAAGRSAAADLIVNRPRPGRSCPRVKKRRMKEYDLMNKPRSHYAQPGEHE